jgi:hypothetical protein
MDIYIPKEQMPSKCVECSLQFKAKLWSCCTPLMLYKDECTEIKDKDVRLPNCPLKSIDRWRLESCKTCKLRSTYMCRNRYDGIETHDPHGDTTCKDWQEKVNE